MGVRTMQKYLVALAIALFSVSSIAADGVVTFASGKSYILRSGQQIPVRNGTQVNAGDLFVTGADGRVRWRMTDNSAYSLRPNARMQVETYRMPKATESPSVGRITLRLFVGTLRTVTGLIGKRNHAGWALHTPTATMGIRGSTLITNVDPNGNTQAMFTEGRGMITPNPQGGSGNGNNGSGGDTKDMGTGQGFETSTDPNTGETAAGESNDARTNLNSIAASDPSFTAVDPVPASTGETGTGETGTGEEGSGEEAAGEEGAGEEGAGEEGAADQGATDQGAAGPSPSNPVSGGAATTGPLIEQSSAQ